MKVYTKLNKPLGYNQTLLNFGVSNRAFRTPSKILGTTFNRLKTGWVGKTINEKRLIQTVYILFEK